MFGIKEFIFLALSCSVPALASQQLSAHSSQGGIWPSLSIIIAVGILAGFSLLGVWKRNKAGQTNQELNLCYEILNTTLDTIQSGVLIIDCQGKPTKMNRFAKNFFGNDSVNWTAEEWALKYQFFHLDNLAESLVLKQLPGHLVLKDQSTQGGVFFLKGAEDSGRYIECNGVPLKDAAGVLITFMDVTSKFLIEEERQRSFYSAKMAAIGEIAGNLAHEVNTPMCTMKLVLDGMFKHPSCQEDERICNSLSLIQKSLFRIERTITIFRGYCRTTRECEEIEIFNLEQVLDNAVEIFSADFNFNQIQVIKELPKAPIICESYSGILIEVLRNLLVNSRDALKGKEGAMIWVTAAAEDGVVTVEFRDNGHGVRPELAREIFKPFFSTKENSSGIGLGAARHYMKLMQGDLVYIAGSHSTFKLSFKQNIHNLIQHKAIA